MEFDTSTAQFVLIFFTFIYLGLFVQYCIDHQLNIL